jgi:hypothetical protein
MQMLSFPLLCAWITAAAADVVQMKVSECDFHVHSHRPCRLCEEVTTIFLRFIDGLNHIRVHQRRSTTQMEIHQFFQGSTAGLPDVNFEVVHTTAVGNVAETVADWRGHGEQRKNDSGTAK